MDLNDLLLAAINAGATDVHLKLGRPPILRYDGALTPLESWTPVTPADLESVLATVTTANRQKEADFRATGELDFAYTSNDETIAEGTFFEMQSGDHALIDPVLDGDVDRDVASAAARSHHDVAIALEQALKAKAAEERLNADQPALPTLRS